jgi:hypothetical protein
MTNTARSVENEKIVVKIRIYTGENMGGMSSYPTFSFNSALQIVVSCWSTKLFIDNKSLNVRETGWSEKDFVDWLLGVDIHMIISHPHQGTETFQWDVFKLYEEIGRLHDHIGFPFKEQLVCPIFTQNKFSYLEPLCQFGMTNPFIKDCSARGLCCISPRMGSLLSVLSYIYKKLFCFIEI